MLFLSRYSIVVGTVILLLLIIVSFDEERPFEVEWEYA